jgi:hypothetical protein
LYFNGLYTLTIESDLTCYNIETVKEDIEPCINPLEKGGAGKIKDFGHNGDHDQSLNLVKVNEEDSDVM